MTTSESERDEWLIDESLKETFPASDPTSPARPGSLVGLRYAASTRAAERTPSSLAKLPWLIGALAGGVVVGLILTRRRELSASL